MKDVLHHERKREEREYKLYMDLNLNFEFAMRRSLKYFPV